VVSVQAKSRCKTPCKGCRACRHAGRRRIAQVAENVGSCVTWGSSAGTVQPTSNKGVLTFPEDDCTGFVQRRRVQGTVEQPLVRSRVRKLHYSGVVCTIAGARGGDTVSFVAAPASLGRSTGGRLNDAVAQHDARLGEHR